MPGNAVFIPEANRAGRAEAAADALFSFGALDAIGFSPFSIESIEEPENNPLASVYEILANMDKIILTHQGRHIRLAPDRSSVQRIRLYSFR